MSNISTPVLNDLINSTLSPQAAFLSIYLGSRPKEWEINRKEICKRMQCNDEALSDLIFEIAMNPISSQLSNLQGA